MDDHPLTRNTMVKASKKTSRFNLRVYKRDHDVSSSFGRVESFVVVSQASWVHQYPALLGALDRAVVPDKSAPATFKVDASMVECKVDGVC